MWRGRRRKRSTSIDRCLWQTRQTLSRLLGHLEDLQERRAVLLERGTEESSARRRATLAREILALDRRARAVEAQVALLQRLSGLLMRVVAAETQATLSRQLARSLPTEADLSFPLTSLERGLAQQMALADRLDALVAILGGTVMGDRSPVEVPLEPEVGTVAHVIDGDTVVLEDGRRVRYVGIDAPEMKGPFGRAEPFAEEAAWANRDWVKGRCVHLEQDCSQTDRFGRLLRHVCVDACCVGVELVRDGLARALPLYPDLSRADEILAAEQEARRAQRGIGSM